MAEWSKALDRFEWSALANSRIMDSLRSVTVQPSCPVEVGTLVALYKCEGLLVALYRT